TAFFVDTRSMLSPEAMNLCDMGLKVVPIDRGDKGAYDFGFMLDWLFKRGVRYVLCEGGGKLALSLMEAGLCDMLLLHLSPKILGDSEAKPVFAGRSPLAMDEALGFRLAKTEALGEDLALTLFPRPASRQER
ncbi:MAG: dihydrofolate reductase family protein, partial [Desulfovibrio sp.]|nr:dihydrofolate reductase family protein [Desulfovibrio sp.]